MQLKVIESNICEYKGKYENNDISSVVLILDIVAWGKKKTLRVRSPSKAEKASAKGQTTW